MLFLEQNGQSNSLHWAIFQQLKKKKKIQFKLSQGERTISCDYTGMSQLCLVCSTYTFHPTYQEAGRTMWALCRSQSARWKVQVTALRRPSIWLCVFFRRQYWYAGPNWRKCRGGGFILSETWLQTRYMTKLSSPSGMWRTCRSNSLLFPKLQNKLECGACWRRWKSELLAEESRRGRSQDLTWCSSSFFVQKPQDPILSHRKLSI